MTNAWQQFRILFGQFLFRIVDLELLSPQGDITKLLGRMATVLIIAGIVLSLGVLQFGDLPYEDALVQAWGLEHRLIATTMLVSGILAVLSWDTTFPSLEDTMVLGILPVQGYVVFLARVCATAAALGVAVVAVNAPSGALLPLALGPPSRNALDFVLSPERYRAFAAFWLTMAGAGLFVYGSVISLQAVASWLLPRLWFLRVAALLQLLVFCSLVCVYVLQPTLTTPAALGSPKNEVALAWLPSYWFLGWFQHLNGTMPDVMGKLAERAWAALAGMLCFSAAAYSVTYARLMRQIVEMPDILPGAGRFGWFPGWGHSLAGTITEFVWRTVARSRQHRVTLAFYLGIGLAVTILFANSPRGMELVDPVKVLPFFASLMMVTAAVAGLRVAFNMPINPKANWIFRVTEVRDAQEYLRALRRSLFAVGVAPAWAVSAVYFLLAWPFPIAAGHLVLLALWGSILAWLLLYHFEKIPFTCAWSPGAGGRGGFLAVASALQFVALGSLLELWLLERFPRFVAAAGVMTALCFAVRWLTTRRGSHAAVVRFDEPEEGTLVSLSILRDGVLPD
ncbi:MAG: hypothetical protein IT169_06505 [Bryobacterales bacterium]|nr:hypothetical protein [Bryobacterales bacterium]